MILTAECSLGTATVKPFDFADATALVVGGARGLGFALAEGLADHGAHVVITSRNTNDLSTAISHLSDERGMTVHGMEMDITDGDSIQRVLKTVDRRFGGSLNIAINAAGITTTDRAVFDLPPTDWDMVMETNVRGAYLFARSVLPLLKNAEWARLIHITSIFATVTVPDISAYAASKGALLQLTRTLALEWAKFNITVNALAPGPFKTDMMCHILEDEELHEGVRAAVPLGRLAEPRELVSAGLFLASRGSSFVTGASIVVDGGWTVR
jgi:NAD(P)-dependent dehydrogenase (short-subunit alcohol dehydrogenase family)